MQRWKGAKLDYASVSEQCLKVVIKKIIPRKGSRMMQVPSAKQDIFTYPILCLAMEKLFRDKK